MRYAHAARTAISHYRSAYALRARCANSYQPLPIPDSPFPITKWKKIYYSLAATADNSFLSDNS
ncbi:MAG: hypothetical protein F6J98_11220 [Moorea sp. SIO4G2]|nr:hypothetical protein [Moorena sp. SIO4G2]